jgi:serine/threonine protein kinase
MDNSLFAMSEPNKSDDAVLHPTTDADETVAAGAPLRREELEGDTIGRYKLLERIGEGGFGSVYVAEQKEPVKRLVALKITKLGMDTKQVIARFEAERQALALMDHPNIAKVLDAGATETGRPFFVMELVRGVKITEFCDQRKLSTRKRLGLFIQVCRAIEHAHQKGVIHRDIKPSNILVTLHDNVPVPKVIDFGIAKATQGTLTDKTVYTQFDQFVGTPAYMSPEQAEMNSLDIDTRSDLYSLGVLLYELLTSSTPFESKNLLERGFDEMRRIIREIEPLRPSLRLHSQKDSEKTNTASRHGTDSPKLINLVRGDLDWVVMKCLEKDRTRRYDTAGSLAADVQRFLDNEPVEARPPSKLYRFRKLVRRHRLVFASGSLVLLSLLAALGLTTSFVIKEKQQRDLAQTAARNADVDRAVAEAERDRAKAANIRAEASRSQAEIERQKAEVARQRAESALAQSEAAETRAEDARKEAETARQQAELALLQARADRAKAEVADLNAKNSQSQAATAERETDLALKQTVVAESRAVAEATKSEAAAKAAAVEASLRQQAETAAKIATADAALARNAISNILLRLNLLSPAEALKASAIFFAPGDENQLWAAQFLRQRASWHARHGDWQDAAADYSELLEMDPSDPDPYHALSLLLAQTRQWDAYARHCALITARFAGTTNPATAQLLAQSCLLAPAPGLDLTILANWARISADPLTLALVEYRQAHFSSAATLAAKAALQTPARAAQATALVALAQQQLEHPGAARPALTDNVQILQLPTLELGDIGLDWRDWIAAQVLVREASTQVQPPVAPPKLQMTNSQ